MCCKYHDEQRLKTEKFLLFSSGAALKGTSSRSTDSSRICAMLGRPTEVSAPSQKQEQNIRRSYLPGLQSR